MNNHASFESAMAFLSPVESLRTILQDLLHHGHTRDWVYQELEDFRAVLSTQNRAIEEDSVLEVMDFFVGWCSPQSRI